MFCIHVGVQVDLPGVPTSVTLKAFTICACFDLPARASVLNTIQYNGEYGCNFCEQSDSTVRTESGGSIHDFFKMSIAQTDLSGLMNHKRSMLQKQLKQTPWYVQVLK